MVELPGVLPVTIPEVVPILATVVFELVHDPPPASVNVIVPPTHTGVLPDMAAGNGFTVIGLTT